MVSQLITIASQSLPVVASPLLASPRLFSPGSPAHVPFPATFPANNYFMEFCCRGEPLGRIVIKVLEGASHVGQEFQKLVTAQNGFGYKGSRVYACCNKEWVLLGDLLYDTPRPPRQPSTYWDPRLLVAAPEKNGGSENDSTDSVAPAVVHHGSRSVVQAQDPQQQAIGRGAVMSVASDLNLDTGVWRFGPQLKICLSDTPTSSGRVVGQVVEGMEVVERLSGMDGRGPEPKARITITDCGAC